MLITQGPTLHHPIQSWLAEAHRTSTAVIRHHSVLGNIFNQFPFTRTKIETIEPYIRPPWWTSRIRVQVPINKAVAKDLHDKLAPHIPEDTMVIYTDGSGIDEQTGAAAYNKSLNQTTHQYLGRQEHYNVYGAELSAIDLGISQWRKRLDVFPNCHIFTDNQATCASVQKPGRQSGQSIIASTLDKIDTTERQISITWIPGHMDIDGNERADSEAKHAATTPKASPPFRYTPMKACRVQYIRTMAKEQWNKTWLESTTTARQLRRITGRQGIKTGPRIYINLPSRKTCAQIVQLRTRHCGLNSHLHRIGKTDNPSCECGYKMEAVEHFSLECKNYKDPRKELRRTVGSGKMKVASLIGDTQLLIIHWNTLRP